MVLKSGAIMKIDENMNGTTITQTGGLPAVAEASTTIPYGLHEYHHDANSHSRITGND
jgi:hypothetical protein